MAQSGLVAPLPEFVPETRVSERPPKIVHQEGELSAERGGGAETKAPKRHVKSNRQLAETKRVRESRPFAGKFAMNREISVCARLRGGPGRSRRNSRSHYDSRKVRAEAV